MSEKRRAQLDKSIQRKRRTKSTGESKTTGPTKNATRSHEIIWRGEEGGHTRKKNKLKRKRTAKDLRSQYRRTGLNFPKPRRLGAEMLPKKKSGSLKMGRRKRSVIAYTQQGKVLQSEGGGTSDYQGGETAWKEKKK